MNILDLFRGKVPLVSMESKVAYDLQRIGVQGRAQYPSTDIDALQLAYRRNEIVYAAIRAKVTAANDPRLLVQRRAGDGTWQEIEGHPLRRLMMRPNPQMDESMFTGAAIANRDIAGRFYAEIVRAAGSKQPIELHPLNPAKVAPVPGEKGRIASYEFRDGTHKVTIPAEDMIDWTYYDPTRRWQGLSPVAVALGSIDSDSAQTDYTREFFNNGGVPGGILKITGRTIGKEEADELKARWRARFGLHWGTAHDVAVLDENAEYQKIGANLDELQSEILREFTETRVAMVLGVPPLIIYAFAGLKRATYSNLKEALPGFWDTTMSPLLKEWRTFLTWRLLTEFESEDLVFGERIRLNYDMSQVAALQEDVDALHMRSRESFKIGGITLNEHRATIGMPPDPAGDYYLRTLAQVAEPAGQQPTEPEPVKRVLAPRAVKAMRDTSTRGIERQIRQVVRPYLVKQYAAAAQAVRS